MKTIHALALVTVAVAATIAIEESRIAALRTDLQAARATSGPAASAARKPAGAPAETAAEPQTRSRVRPAAEPAAAPAADKPAAESMAKTMRQIYDNPAGKSLMDQQTKLAVGMMYEGLISRLDLSGEEQEYFKSLLGKGISAQQELGMKMMGATPEERKALAADLETRKKENREEIRQFLNNEADMKVFEDYEARLPEHQQVAGIRAVMSGAGEPLDEATEGKLVDALFRARTQSGAPDLSGAAGLEMLEQGNIVEVFEKSWDAQQEKLRQETGNILTPSQQAAFEDYQKQAKQLQLMGLKMAEQMFPKKTDEGK